MSIARPAEKRAAAPAAPAPNISSQEQQVIADLNANQFGAAWNTALSTSAEYGTNYGATTKDPLLAALESSSGLEQLDPTKQWTAQETSQFYGAFEANPVYRGQAPSITAGGTESLGKNPYGTWGSASGIPGDIQANLSQEGTTPDVQRFVGARPSASFLSKYGGDIAALALAVAAPEAIPAIEGAIGATGVAGAVEAGALYGAGAGAVKGAVSGGNIGKDIAIGAVGGGVVGGVGAEVSSLGANSVETGLATSATKIGLTELAGSTLTSSSGKGTAALSPGVMPAGATVAASPQAMSTIDPVNAPTTFTGGLEAGLGASLGSVGGNLAGTLGSTLGSIAPYAAIGAIGEAQASTGEAQAQKYSQEQQNLAQPAIAQSNTLLGKYNTGTIDPLSQRLSNTEIAQGSSLLNAPTTTGLSAIANQAFSGYLTGKLQPAQQTQLDQTTAAQKQAVAAQLSAAGITDSSVLQAQYQQIDDQALITKQNMINSNFATGVTAYDQWLQTTTEGQQTIQAGMTVASNALQTELQNSMQEAGIGIGEMNTAISTQMQTDAEYAGQVSSLLGTLATAYARQAAGNATGSKTGSSVTGIPGVGQAVGAASSALNSPVTGSTISGLTSGATSGNAADIAAAGNAELANTPMPNLSLPSTDLGALGNTISGDTSSWVSDLGGGSYYG